MASQTEIRTGYWPRPLQAEIHRKLKRFNVLVCHRRFGKTVMCIADLVDQCLRCEKERPRFAYIAPLYRQAKQAAWDYLKAYTESIPDAVAYESELRVDMPNGGRLQLFGADTPDALRGIYLDGVVLDEYAQMSPRMWAEVVRPALADREGMAIFIGTPRGRNAFCELYEDAESGKAGPDWFGALFKASETMILPQAELEAAERDMGDDEYAQEFECSFEAAIKGAYYGALMSKATAEGRIGVVPYETGLPVETWWDLGIGDSTAIWFAQRTGREVRLIDYYEASGEGLAHYAKVLQDKGYVYGRHIAPHDITVRELGSGQSRKDTAEKLGIRFEVVSLSGVDDGIQAVRDLLPRCWFDRSKCAPGIECLRQYRKEWNERLNNFLDKPRHDWASHGADAFRYGATARDRVKVDLANIDPRIRRGSGKPLAWQSI